MKEIRPVFVRGARKALLEALMRLSILASAVAVIRRPGAVRQALRRFRAFYDSVRTGDPDRLPVFRGRVYWNMHIPPWPGRAWRAFIRDIVPRFSLTAPKTKSLLTMVFAVTKQCRYRCEHCYAGRWVNGPDSLSRADLIRIMHLFQRRGVWQIQLSGGEPLLRADDVLALLGASRGPASFQLLTTGDGLTPRLAERLKAAGLTGVVLSLDHWDPGKHNAFRKNDAAYGRVLEAAARARRAGLMVSLSLCPTNEFLEEEENLWRYFDLARSLGACFVRVLEPRREGNYALAEVDLGESAKSALERFFRKANNDPAFRRYPMVVMPAYLNWHAGCVGAGELFIDVDADGNVNPCPFRQIQAGNCLTESLEAIIGRMKSDKCDCGYAPIFG